MKCLHGQMPSECQFLCKASYFNHQPRTQGLISQGEELGYEVDHPPVSYQYYSTQENKTSSYFAYAVHRVNTYLAPSKRNLDLNNPSPFPRNPSATQPTQRSCGQGTYKYLEQRRSRRRPIRQRAFGFP